MPRFPKKHVQQERSTAPLDRKTAALLFGLGFLFGFAAAGAAFALGPLDSFSSREKQKAAQKADIKKAKEKLEEKMRLTPNIALWERSLLMKKGKNGTDEAGSPETETPDKNDKVTIKGEIGKGDTIKTAFARAGLNYATIENLTAALAKEMDVRKLQLGEKFVAYLDKSREELIGFEYIKTKAQKYYARYENGELRAYKQFVPIDTALVPVSGEITSNLSAAIEEVGESAVLTEMFADVFAYDINFFTDSRKGDKFRMLVEKKFINGEFAGFGKLVAAEYQGYKTGPKYAFLFEIPDSKDQKTGWYDEKGKSLRRAFLKAPLSTVKITSVFGLRMHPVLGRMKQHKGVDFGAPSGTPVWAVADGVVLRAGWAGGCGNEIFIKHNNGYSSRFCHLSKILTRAGSRVSQKQQVGAVGNTGISTGPHLHYELMQNGAHINPLKVKFDDGPPVPTAFKPEFDSKAEELRNKLFTLGWPKKIGPEPFHGAALDAPPPSNPPEEPDDFNESDKPIGDE